MDAFRAELKLDKPVEMRVSPTVPPFEPRLGLRFVLTLAAIVAAALYVRCVAASLYALALYPRSLRQWWSATRDLQLSFADAHYAQKILGGLASRSRLIRQGFRPRTALHRAALAYQNRFDAFSASTQDPTPRYFYRLIAGLSDSAVSECGEASWIVSRASYDAILVRSLRRSDLQIYEWANERLYLVQRPEDVEPLQPYAFATQYSSTKLYPSVPHIKAFVDRRSASYAGSSPAYENPLALPKGFKYLDKELLSTAGAVILIALHSFSDGTHSFEYEGFDSLFHYYSSAIRHASMKATEVVIIRPHPYPPSTALSRKAEIDNKVFQKLLATRPEGHHTIYIDRDVEPVNAVLKGDRPVLVITCHGTIAEDAALSRQPFIAIQSAPYAGILPGNFANNDQELAAQIQTGAVELRSRLDRDLTVSAQYVATRWNLTDSQGRGR